MHVLSESRPMRGVRGVDRQPCHGTPVEASALILLVLSRQPKAVSSPAFHMKRGGWKALTECPASPSLA